MITQTFGKGKCLNGNKPNDDILTPFKISKTIIDNFNLYGTILDPFKGKGSFYNQFPTNVKKYGVKLKKVKISLNLIKKLIGL